MPIDNTLLERLKQNDPSLVELKLSYQTPNLTAADMHLLINALLSNTHLKTLNVLGNQLNSEWEEPIQRRIEANRQQIKQSRFLVNAVCIILNYFSSALRLSI